MMAEAAGLVLGGIPIVVTGIEMLLKVVSAGDSYRRYKQRLQDLHHQLSSEEVLYLNMCEELLNGVVDNVQKQVLLDDPYGDAWRTPELEASLKARLSRSYPIFTNCVRNMQANIAGLNELFKVDNQGKVRLFVSNDRAGTNFGQIDINAKRKLEKEYKKLILSLRPSKYEKYVIHIRQDNSTLMKMLGQNQRFEASRASKARKTPDFSTVQRCASSVFAMLCSGFRCNCRALHGVNLLLEADSISRHRYCERADIPTFHLAFSYSCKSEPHEKQRPWDLEVTQVRMSEAAKPIPPTSGTKGVRFAGQHDISCPIPQSLHQASLIANLCDELRRGQKWGLGACVGFLKSQETSQRLEVFAPASPTFRSNAQALSSLHQILREPTSGSRPRFSRLKRLRVAVALAFNLLQLYSTPWLSDAWGGENIRFLDTTDADPYEKPFIARRVTSEGEVQPQGTSFDGFIRNGPLFHLGILLIELCFNEPFERLREKVQSLSDGHQTRVSDYFVADRLLSDVSDEGGITYGIAVTRCIRCNFDTPSLSLENESFREAVYKGVVSLLEDDLAHSLKLPGLP